MGTLQNVPLSDFFKFLKYQGWNYARTTGGHEIWKRQAQFVHWSFKRT